MQHDLLVDALTIIRNAEFVGKKECEVPSSNLVKSVLDVMKKEGYIEDFSEREDGRKIVVKLKGKINDCKAIRPRFAVKKDEFEKFEKRFLPARNFGILIVSTPKGVMTQHEARKLGSGGRVLAFAY
ncbi:MAG: 30S ribosomal protein S8 [Candidatus Aenigmarchaeota archaeon]|nr:30S ribosomal protein S8 [Candidatus Aenigmarchaeota archaeon]